MYLLLALLEVKNVLTHDEAETVADYIANKPQPSHYADALSEAKKLLVPAITPAPQPAANVSAEATPKPAKKK